MEPIDFFELHVHFHLGWIMKKLKILLVAAAATMLSSCDLSQIPGLTGKLSMSDSKAVGAACRHSGRALEDCFALNPNTSQAGVFEGWRDMNDYMLANELEVVKPEIQASSPKQDKHTEGGESANAKPGEPTADPATGPTDAVPLAQGRQRWVPKAPADAAPSADVNEESPASKAPAARALGGDAPAEASAVDAPSIEAPARPWERKKDAKKHT